MEKRNEEIGLDELLDVLVTNVKDDIKDFGDIVSLESSLNRELFLSSIEDGTGSEMATWIKYWNRYDEKHNIPVGERVPITIWIDSTGGSLIDAFTIIDAMKLSKTKIRTIVMGGAYSGAFLVAISGHERLCFKHASYMWHEGSASYGSDANRMRGFQRFYERQLEQLKEITLDNTKIDEDLYLKHQVEDWWMDAAEAIELGVADSYVEGF